jgi:hypothetical protein
MPDRVRVMRKNDIVTRNVFRMYAECTFGAIRTYVWVCQRMLVLACMGKFCVVAELWKYMSLK